MFEYHFSQDRLQGNKQKKIAQVLTRNNCEFHKDLRPRFYLTTFCDLISSKVCDFHKDLTSKRYDFQKKSQHFPFDEKSRTNFCDLWKIFTIAQDLTQNSATCRTLSQKRKHVPTPSARSVSFRKHSISRHACEGHGERIAPRFVHMFHPWHGHGPHFQNWHSHAQELTANCLYWNREDPWLHHSSTFFDHLPLHLKIIIQANSQGCVIFCFETWLSTLNFRAVGNCPKGLDLPCCDATCARFAQQRKILVRDLRHEDQSTTMTCPTNGDLSKKWQFGKPQWNEWLVNEWRLFFFLGLTRRPSPANV